MQTKEFTYWSSLRAGDAAALQALYNIYYKVLINYGMRMSSNLEITEDSIQDLFIDLWKMKSNLGETDSVRNYIISSFRRKLIRNIKKLSPYNELDEAGAESADSQPGFMDEMIIQETDEQNSQKLQEAMKKLSNRQREAIYLRFSEGMEYEQICEVMDLKYQSVRNLVSTAIVKLKEIIVFCLIFFLKI
ncbi:MAG: sigma-70 family RNA polymerase sigma factor [Saprospiraceae bacterium]|nr:sigma-70 family RNA polymerase sigma factor [Saprospiraceae bacterium]